MNLKNCNFCGKEFKKNYKYSATQWREAKWCSKNCSNLGKVKKVTKVCKQCSEKFVVKRYRIRTANYCSFVCRDKGYDQGYTALDTKLRKNAKYKKWRTAVFERDNYRCVQCGINGVLNADHYPLSFKQIVNSDSLSQLWDINNGRTLCVDCHKLTPTYGWKGRLV